MGLSRLNAILMEGILPFNFGMKHEGWIDLYDKFPELVGSDPRTWTPEDIEDCNREAERQTALADRLMTLSHEEFREEVKKLKESPDRGEEGEADNAEG